MFRRRPSDNLWKDLLPADYGVGYRFLKFLLAPADVLLHHSIGERYFSPVGAGTMLIFLGALFFGAFYLAKKIGEWVPFISFDLASLFSPWFLAWVGIFMVAGSVQLLIQLWNVVHHDRPHSLGIGRSILPLWEVLPISENVQQKILEPILVMVIGAVVFWFLDKPFGVYLGLTGLLIGFRSVADWEMAREIVLDALDARKFAEALAMLQMEESSVFNSRMEPVPVIRTFVDTPLEWQEHQVEATRLETLRRWAPIPPNGSTGALVTEDTLIP